MTGKTLLLPNKIDPLVPRIIPDVARGKALESLALLLRRCRRSQISLSRINAPLFGRVLRFESRRPTRWRKTPTALHRHCPPCLHRQYQEQVHQSDISARHTGAGGTTTAHLRGGSQVQRVRLCPDGGRRPQARRKRPRKCWRRHRDTGSPRLFIGRGKRRCLCNNADVTHLVRP